MRYVYAIVRGMSISWKSIWKSFYPIVLYSKRRAQRSINACYKMCPINLSMHSCKVCKITILYDKMQANYEEVKGEIAKKVEKLR